MSVTANTLLWYVDRDTYFALVRQGMDGAQTLTEPVPVRLTYAKRPAALHTKELTDTPEIPARFHLALVDRVLQKLSTHTKETLSQANFYEGEWKDAVRTARAEKNRNRGARHNMIQPVDF